MGTPGKRPSRQHPVDGVFARPPAGENEGGLMIDDPSHWHLADRPVVIELAGKGSVIGKHDSGADADLSGYRS